MGASLHLSSTRRLGLLLGFTLLAAPQAMAEDTKITQVMNLWGHTLSFPPPSWAAAPGDAAKADTSEINRQENETSFLLEMVPKAEGFDRWTRIYGVAAHRGSSWSLEAAESEVVGNYQSGCNDVKVEPLPGISEGALAVLYCGSYKDNPKGGQVGVFRVMTAGDVAVRVYEEWRGASFKPQDGATLPVAAEELQAMIKSLAGAALLPGQ